MSVEWFYWILVIYSAGLCISSFGSIQCFLNRNDLKKNMDIDLFQTRPDLKAYLILKPIFWPYFFIAEKSPVERISELFFKHYGESGHTYLRDHGIKNFLRDLLKGKNRYKNYQVNRLIWPIDKESEDYQEHQKYCSKSNKSLYAEIIYAHYQNKYLVGVMWGNRECLYNDMPISRFRLDQCEPMTFLQFERRLMQINRVKAREFLSNLPFDNKDVSMN